MNDVAEVAGVSRGTVYNHFSDRDALLRAVEDVMFEFSAKDLDNAMASRKGLDEQVAAAALCCRRWLDAELAAGFLSEADAARAIMARSDAVMSVMMKVTVKYLVQAHALGEVREDLNINQAAEWVSRVVVSLAIFESQSFRMDRPNELREFIAGHLTRGLR